VPQAEKILSAFLCNRKTHYSVHNATSRPYAEPDESSFHPISSSFNLISSFYILLGPFIGLSLSDFPIEIFYVFLICPVCTVFRSSHPL
jgi:hypothetical protein